MLEAALAALGEQWRETLVAEENVQRIENSRFVIDHEDGRFAIR
jgi:hypothetical protein